MTLPANATVRLRFPDGALYAYTVTTVQDVEHARRLGQYLWEAKGGIGPYYAAGMRLSYEAVKAPPVIQMPPAPPADPEPMSEPEPRAADEEAPREPDPIPCRPVLVIPLRVRRPRRRREEEAAPASSAPRTILPSPLQVLRVRPRSEKPWRIPERAVLLAQRWGGVRVTVPIQAAVDADLYAVVTETLDFAPLLLLDAAVSDQGQVVVSLTVDEPGATRRWSRAGNADVLEAEPGARRRVVVR